MELLINSIFLVLAIGITIMNVSNLIEIIDFKGSLLRIENWKRKHNF